MASLYKRATPSQKRILRAVEGAVKNVSHCHPEWKIRPNFARSIAKRAAGTLTAQWPEVLAAHSSSSDRGGMSPGANNRPQHTHIIKCSERGASQVQRRSPLVRLWKEISAQIGDIKRSGNSEREKAFIDILKMISAKQVKGEKSSPFQFKAGE